MAKAFQVTANQLTAPRWAGDFITPDRLIPGGAKFDPSALVRDDEVVVVVGTGAIATATSVPVDALTGPVPSGTTLHFGTNKYATLSADAAAGATSITVLAIPTALVDNDSATYNGSVTLELESGTLVGRTIAERDAGTPYGLAGDSDDEIFLVAFPRDAEHTDDDGNIDIELYRHYNVVKENYLPGSDDLSHLSATLKTYVRAHYTCIVGFE